MQQTAKNSVTAMPMRWNRESSWMKADMSFSNTPSHILTIYKGPDPSRRFIAKKVREESNELKIFKLLNTFQSKSEHTSRSRRDRRRGPFSQKWIPSRVMSRSHLTNLMGRLLTFKYPPNRLFKVQGTISDDEMCGPAILDQDDVPLMTRVSSS
ncbi:hypothetical protein BJV77DRAFT_230947 [Russula vinacea]|nr:hypothetical protein BJV77DRAFT_230947 [Russula vinacea]